jgi:hypothetical protein
LGIFGFIQNCGDSDSSGGEFVKINLFSNPRPVHFGLGRDIRFLFFSQFFLKELFNEQRIVLGKGFLG